MNHPALWLSCARDVAYAHPGSFVDEPDAASAFGVVKATVHAPGDPPLFTLYGASSPLALDAGTYAMRLRARFTPTRLGPDSNAETTYPSNLYAYPVVDGVQQAAMIKTAAAQPHGVWFETEPFVFTVTQSRQPVTAAFGGLHGACKVGYAFDRLVIAPADAP